MSSEKNSHHYPRDVIIAKPPRKRTTPDPEKEEIELKEFVSKILEFFGYFAVYTIIELIIYEIRDIELVPPILSLVIVFNYRRLRKLERERDKLSKTERIEF